MADPNYENIGSLDTRVIEECAEVIQAICKAQRFGWRNYHPDRMGTTNAYDILEEIADARKAFDKLEYAILSYRIT